MQQAVFAIPVRAPGRLLIGPRPNAADLPGAMRALAAEGVDAVFSLLTAEEAAELGLATEGTLCADNGMAFRSMPIPDYGLPTPDQLASARADIGARLDAGHTVFVHCRAGIGRSGMTACAVLIDRGTCPEDALRIVSDARGLPVPDTAEQQTFVLSLT